MTIHALLPSLLLKPGPVVTGWGRSKPASKKTALERPIGCCLIVEPACGRVSWATVKTNARHCRHIPFAAARIPAGIGYQAHQRPFAGNALQRSRRASGRRVLRRSLCRFGAVGIEALSRGASQVWFVEEAPSAVGAIRANLASLKIESGFHVEVAASRPRWRLWRGARSEDRGTLFFSIRPMRLAVPTAAR